MERKLVENGIMKMSGLSLTLPENFKVNYSLDLTDSEILQLPNGLNVEGSLILGNSKINALPSKLIVGEDLIMTTELKIPEDALIGGFIITPNRKNPAPLRKNHFITTDDQLVVIYRNEKIVTEERIHDFEDYYFPKTTYYQNINKNYKNAIKYIEDNKTYVLSCKDLKDGFYKIYWNRAKVFGIDKYKNYDIYEPRTVKELEEIYYTCTGACGKGISKFLKDFNIDKNKKYTIKELMDMVEKTRHSPKVVFLEFFGQNNK